MVNEGGGDVRRVLLLPRATTEKALKMGDAATETIMAATSPTCKSDPGAARCEARRAECVELTPEALVRLHKLNEASRRYSMGPKPVDEDTSDAALDKDWGPWGGWGLSWQVYGQLPPAAEAPMNQRAFKARPERGLDAEALMHNHRLALLNTKGRKGDDTRTKGQDACSYSHLPSGWDVLCVMDGHGQNGHWPAVRACRSLPFFLKGSSCGAMLRQGQAEAALLHAFGKVQMDLKTRAWKEKIDLHVCGCTAVCVLWDPDRRSVWVATAGDSRAVLIVPGRGAVAQTQDHKPSVESERLRVERHGGEVVSTEFDDGYVETRINVKGQDFPGISMTRSLGDLCVKNCGVIAEPEVTRWDAPADGVIVAASDGVWEFMSTEEVADKVLGGLEQGLSHKEIAQEVLQAAREAWQENEGSYCDDITLAIVPAGATRVLRREATLRRLRGGCCEGALAAAGGCQVM